MVRKCSFQLPVNAVLTLAHPLLRTMMSRSPIGLQRPLPKLAIWGRRVALYIVACCLAVQGMALSAERVLGGRHFHLAAPHAAVRHTGDLDGHRYAPEIVAAASSMAHEHLDLQHHDHDIGLAGVVHLADDGNASSQNPYTTLIRSVHDLHLLIPAVKLPLAAEHAPIWTLDRAGRFDSHVSPPLERPPQP